jgi:hypothetical protein
MTKPTLDADTVLRAARELLDEVGLQGFTMRALAQRLERLRDVVARPADGAG